MMWGSQVQEQHHKSKPGGCQRVPGPRAPLYCQIQASISPVSPYFPRTSATSTPWGCYGRWGVAGVRRNRGQSAAPHWQAFGRPRLPRRVHVKPFTTFTNVVEQWRMRLVRGVQYQCASGLFVRVAEEDAYAESSCCSDQYGPHGVHVNENEVSARELQEFDMASQRRCTCSLEKRKAHLVDQNNARLT